MSYNKLSADDIKKCWFLNCPECSFKTKTKITFETHVYEKHPTSLVFFGNNRKLPEKTRVENSGFEEDTSNKENKDDNSCSTEYYVNQIGMLQNAAQTNTEDENELLEITSDDNIFVAPHTEVKLEASEKEFQAGMIVLNEMNQSIFDKILKLN